MIGAVQTLLIPLVRRCCRDLFQAPEGGPCHAGGLPTRAGGDDRYDQEDW